MKKNIWKTVVKRVSFSTLIATMVLTVSACGSENATEEPQTQEGVEVASEGKTTEETELLEPVGTIGTDIGEGETVFTFEVKHADGMVTYYNVNTDAETVGKALQGVELIAGDDSEFGLYVKTVDGVTIDPDTESKYWAFYENGEMATTGVDQIEIVEGVMYTFAVESL